MEIAGEQGEEKFISLPPHFDGLYLPQFSVFYLMGRCFFLVAGKQGGGEALQILVPGEKDRDREIRRFPFPEKIPDLKLNALVPLLAAGNPYFHPFLI